MCEQCLAETVTIGEVVPGIVLVRATVEGCYMEPGEFGLVESNDPFHTFTQTPRPDPCAELSDNDVDALNSDDTNDMLDWHFAARRFAGGFVVDLNVGWRVVQACIKAGYNPEEDGDATLWLFHRLGVLLQEKGNGQGLGG